MVSVDYNDVISGKIRKPSDKWVTSGVSFMPVTFVSWDNAPKFYKDVYFYTIGKTPVILPPVLPDGCFNMVDHPDWYAIAERIRDGVENASFERIDLMVLDLETLADCAGSSWIADTVDYWPWDIRDDYLEWSTSFDQEWDGVFFNVYEVVKEALDNIGDEYPDYVPTQSTTDQIADYLRQRKSDRLPLPNRSMPPPKSEIIQYMIDYLVAFKTILEGEES